MWYKNSITYVLITILLWAITIKASDIKEKTADLARLNHEIVLLNLINGLYLTEEQAESMIQKIEQAQKIRKKFYEQLYKNKSEFEEILKDLKHTLVQDKPISDKLKKQIYSMKQKQHDLEDRKGERLVIVQEDIKKILSKNQLILIEEFRPCTIPPKTGRIGQSVETGSERLVQLLGKIRNMPSRRYHMVKDMFADMHVDKIEKYIQKFSGPERKEYRQKILETYDKARQLSDKEFLIQKSILVQDIMPEHETSITHKKYQLDKVGRFLLDETSLHILKEKFGK